MPQLIVTVNRLNKRKSVPLNFADKSSIIGVVNKGFRFEGQEVSGIPNAAVGKWYKDRDNAFYWGGGLMELGAGLPVAAPAAAQPGAVIGGRDLQTDAGLAPVADQGLPDYSNTVFTKDKMSWAHDRLQIPAIWKDTGTAGNNVVVAVIDSGVDLDHPDLADVVIAESVSINSKGEIDNQSDMGLRVKDNMGHGTQMTGIIAARGRKLIFGIAPQVKVLVVKILEPAEKVPGIPAAALEKAFEYIAGLQTVKVDMISVSLTTNEASDTLKKNIKANIDKGTAIFGAIGDFHTGQDMDKDLYPSCSDNCTAIGAFDVTGALCSFSQWNAHLSLLAPGDDDVLTTGLTTGPGKGVDEGGETSIACAVTAASFALLISHLKRKQGADYSGKATDHLHRLFDVAEDMGDHIKRDPKHGFGRLNLRNAIALINNQ